MEDKHIQADLKRGDLSNITTYQAGVVQAAAHRNIQKYCDAILRPYGITKMHWLIIGTLFDHQPDGLRITDLANIIGTNVPYLTTTINLLQNKDMVTRDYNKKDARSKLVMIDPVFALKCEEIENALRDHLRDLVYPSVDPAEFRVYMRVLHQLAEVK